MVIGLLTITSIPTVIGVGQAVSAQKKQNAAQKESAKFNLTAERSVNGQVVEEDFCVLVDGRLYVDHAEHPVRGHRFDGYYFTYPGEDGHRGLVSTISVDPPMLNWIFVDASTRAVRFGSRKDSLGHVTGPWGWSADEKYLALHGRSDGFILIRERAEPAQMDNDGNASANDDAASNQNPGGEAPSTGKGKGSNSRPHICWALYWDPDGELRKRQRRKDWRAIQLRRRMKLGMESSYVKADS